MAFNKQAFQQAAKGLGYTDEEINSVASMQEMQTQDVGVKTYNAPAISNQPVNTYQNKTTVSNNPVSPVNPISPVTPVAKTMSVGDKKAKLLSMGYSEAEINKALGIQTAQESSSLAGNVGKAAIEGTKSAASLIGSTAMKVPEFAVSLAKELIKPAVKGAKTIASGAEEAIQTGQYLAGNKKSFESPIIPDAIKLSPKEKQQIREKPLEEAVKQVAGVGSYAIPFGKLGFIGSKAVLPGAAVAGLRSISEGDAPEEVLGNSIIGGATAGTLQLGGKLLSKLKSGASKMSKVSGKVSEDIERGTRQIKQKASVYGAGQEKAIIKTLDRLGFKGTPQQQYEKLQPAMQNLEGKIQKFVKSNPQISVPKEEIKQSFLTNLKSSLRSGELTEAQAVKETNKYLNDLIKSSGGTGKFTNIDIGRLRSLKKLVNEDYGPVKEIIDRGGNLTPKQHVIKVAWDSLDSAVKKSAPEIKSLLLDESNLYKAAQSLSSARFNPPTLRFAGISIPQSLSQAARDMTKGVADKASKGLGNISKVIPNIKASQNTKYLGGQMSSIIPRLSGAPPANEVADTLQNSINEGVDDAKKYDYQNNSHPDILPQNPQDINLGQSFMTGQSPEYWNAQYQQAMQQSPPDTTTAKFADDQFTKEMAYQKTNAPKPKSLSVAGSKEVSRNQTALNDIKELETILEKDPSKLILSALPGSLGARKYRALWGGILDAIGTNRTGATYTPAQRKDYEYLLPAIGDTPDELKFKISRIKLEVSNFLNNVSTSTPDIYRDDGQGLGATPPQL